MTGRPLEPVAEVIPKVLRDTSVLSGADALSTVEAAISRRGGVDPLPSTVEVARAWRRRAAAVGRRGGNPRRRQIDLAIVATATGEHVPLLSHDLADFEIISDLVDARRH